MGIRDCTENAQSAIRARASIFTCKKFICLKIVVHVVFQVKGFSPERFRACAYAW